MLTSFIRNFPIVSSTVPIICLMDAANCIRLGHDDTLFPLLIALASSTIIKRTLDS